MNGRVDGKRPENDAARNEELEIRDYQERVAISKANKGIAELIAQMLPRLQKGEISQSQFNNAIAERKFEHVLRISENRRKDELFDRMADLNNRAYGKPPKLVESEYRDNKPGWKDRVRKKDEGCVIS